MYFDHQALRWVFNLKTPTGRLPQRAIRLQASEFEVRYKKGADNIFADCVSRLTTNGHCHQEAYVEFPVFIVQTPMLASTTTEINKGSWELGDWEPEVVAERMEDS